MLRRSVLTAVLLACSACGAGEAPNERAASGAPPGDGLPAATPGAGAPAPISGSFGGVYEVPVSVALAGAATFGVSEINWSVVDGIARLSYNLPRELVGKSVRVDFIGPFDPVTQRATMTGEAGSSECVVSATEIVCTETMRGLLPLNPDLAVVEKLAAGTYAGPAQDRLRVATQFGGDPIGIARLDLRLPGAPEPAEVEVEKPH